MDDALIGYLFDDKAHILTAPLSQWIGESRRFETFATTYRDKIRKKIRITRSSAGIKDLAAELEIANWLLQEKRFTLDYEPYNSQGTRGPDFAVSFKSNTFNVEVTRIHDSPSDSPSTPDAYQTANRLADTVCDKLGQMRPSMINTLTIVADNAFLQAIELDQAMAHLRERAERKDPNFFQRYRFGNTAGFFKYFLRLSALLLRPTSRQDSPPPSVLWLNNQAKHPLSGSLQTILQRL